MINYLKSSLNRFIQSKLIYFFQALLIFKKHRLNISILYYVGLQKTFLLQDFFLGNNLTFISFTFYLFYSFSLYSGNFPNIEQFCSKINQIIDLIWNFFDYDFSIHIHIFFSCDLHVHKYLIFFFDNLNYMIFDIFFLIFSYFLYFNSLKLLKHNLITYNIQIFNFIK